MHNETRYVVYRKQHLNLFLSGDQWFNQPPSEIEIKLSKKLSAQSLSSFALGMWCECFNYPGWKWLFGKDDFHKET